MKFRKDDWIYSFLTKIQKLLKDKSRDEIFEFPLVYGQTIHYVPDVDCKESIFISSDYENEFLFDEDIFRLRGLAGFGNSLAFDDEGSVCIAKDNHRIIGVAGAAIFRSGLIHLERFWMEVMFMVILPKVWH